MQKMWAHGLRIIRTTLEKSPQSMANSNNTLRLVSLILQDQCKWPLGVAEGAQLMACYQWQWEGCLMLWTFRESQWWRCTRGKNERSPQRSAGARASDCQGGKVRGRQHCRKYAEMGLKKFYHCKPRMVNFKETEGYDYNLSSGRAMALKNALFGISWGTVP